MNRLSVGDRTRVLAALVEGNSIRGTCRMTGFAKGTVLRLLAEVGDACMVYQNEVMQNLGCSRLQLDEIWSFCHAKQKNVPKERRGDPTIGDMWTWIAIDADTKLVPCWLLGKRDAWTGRAFLLDLASRLRDQRVQISTDGFNAYVPAVMEAFGGYVDFGVIMKLYGLDVREGEKRYSPSICTGIKRWIVTGDPDEDHISTSYIERQNLTLRMGSRRFTRLTNAFSKKMENLARALALHFMYYNFCRKHATIKTTPAMAAGVADHLWTLHEVARLADSMPLPKAA